MKMILNQGNWAQVKIMLKKKYPQLEEKDLQHEEGEEENMLRMVEYKVGKTKEEMREILSEYYRNLSITVYQ